MSDSVNAPAAPAATAPYLLDPTDVFNDFLDPVAAATQASGGPLVETVGPGQQFATLSAAIAASVNGTVIYVQAGTYTNDFATITNSISIIGVGGMVNMVATEPPPNLKGILTVDNNVTIENLAFSGSAIDAADGGNGAGIRYEGGVMVLNNDAFENNQDGIMGSPVIASLTKNTISINHSYFYDNGAGDGYTHNAYIGDVASLTFTDNISTGANAGHELKSRALVNTITGNVLADGPSGDASYEIDLPDGGTDVVANNIIEKGPNAQNNNMVHFGGEGIPYAGSSLTVENNTFENDTGGAVTAVLNQTAISVAITGDTLDNITVPEIASGPAVETNNVDGNGAPLANTTLTGVIPGSTLMLTDSLPHTVTLDGNPYLAVEGGGGPLTVYAANGHIVAIGGAGGMKFSESATSGGNQITTAAGATDTINLNGVGGDSLDSEGNDTITVGQGNVGAAINGTAKISDGSGNNQYSVNGTATVTGHGGNPRFSVGPSGEATVNGAVGFLEFNNNGGTIAFDVTEPNGAGKAVEDAMSMVGGAANIQVYQNSAGTPQIVITTAGGSNGATIRLKTGNAVITSAGSDTIYADAGTTSVMVEGAATVWAGSGALSVYGHSDTAGAVVHGAGGSVTLDGDTGDITYYGGAAANTVNDVLSRDILIGGTGRMTVVGGSHETITGGSGGVIYTSADGGGGNSITTAAGSVNLLHLAAADTIISNGIDTIQGGNGNSSFTLNGNAVLDGSTGNSQVTVNGRATIYGLGQDWITVNRGANATIYSQGHGEYVSESNATVCLMAGTGAGAASATVVGGTASLSAGAGGPVNVSTTNGGGGATITAGGGVVDIASAGGDQIHAGVGADVITLYGTGSQVWGGNGAATTVNDNDYHPGDTVTVHGGTGALVYNDGGYGTLTFIGGSGAALINGGQSRLMVTAGSGAMTLSGGTGTAFVAAMATKATASIALTPYGGTIEFGSGLTTVSEAGWEIDPTTYQFVKGHGVGTDTINGFEVGTDRLSLGSGLSVTSSSLSGGATLLRLNDGTSIRLNGVTSTAHLFG